MACAAPEPVFIPVKDACAFRTYKDPSEGVVATEWDSGVFGHYRQMRTNQCMAFADRMEPHVFDFKGRQMKMTVRQALEKLGDYVDRSDPDLTLPNIVHAFQTAERARAAGKPDWFVLTALVHDVGKMMFCLPGSRPEDGLGGKADEPQFALGGDTWVLGVAIPDCTVFPQLNALNPDADHPVYGSEEGIYAQGCGIMNLRFVIGHDEYTYRMLRANAPPLAAIPEALAIVRLHSCYPWHRGGAYARFMAPGDEGLLAAVNEFNEFDLYSKDGSEGVVGALDIEALWPFYQGLIDRFLPGELLW